MTPAVMIDQLRKSYGSNRAVDGVSLTVEEGEIFGILGPNGSGKTTTVECTYGLRRADSGTIRVFGLDPRTDPDSVGRMVGAQLQDSALPDRIRVGEAVHLFATHARAQVDESSLLERFGLGSKRKASYGSLSGGQKQRLHIVLALVGRARLVFLDEMTTGLDPNARREVWDVVEQLRRDGTTVVLVTHFMDEAARLADRIAVMVGGRVVAQGTPNQVVDQYGGGTRVRFLRPPELHVPELKRIPGVTNVDIADGRVEVLGTGSFLTGLGHALASSGLGDTELWVQPPNLDEAYLRLVATAGPGTQAPEKKGER